MKQHTFLFASALLLASCSNDDLQTETITDEMVFTVYYHGQTNGQPDTYDTTTFTANFTWYNDPSAEEDSVHIPKGPGANELFRTMMNNDSIFVDHTQYPDGVTGGASGRYYGDSLVYDIGWGGLGAQYNYEIRGIKQ